MARLVKRKLTVRGQYSDMIIRTRLRAILYPILLYSVSGAISAYFVWTAVNGQRGLKTKIEYRQKMALLKTELQSLEKQREGWERRIALMRTNAIDKDLLDEEARSILGLVSKDDLVVFLHNTGQN